MVLRMCRKVLIHVKTCSRIFYFSCMNILCKSLISFRPGHTWFGFTILESTHSLNISILQIQVPWLHRQSSQPQHFCGSSTFHFKRVKLPTRQITQANSRSWRLSLGSLISMSSLMSLFPFLLFFSGVI